MLNRRFNEETGLLEDLTVVDDSDAYAARRPVADGVGTRDDAPYP